MREIRAALVDDTKRQMVLLDTASREQGATRCMRLAHYSKGACANVARAAPAAIWREIERKAGERNFPECEATLVRLVREMDWLDSEIAAL